MLRAGRHRLALIHPLGKPVETSLAEPMDLYLTALALGAIGLVAMAFSGFGRHGGRGHGNAGHAGTHPGSAHGSGGHGHAATGHSGGQVHASGHGHSSGHAQSAAKQEGSSNPLLALMSPRVLFSTCLGLGTGGLLLRPVLGGVALFGAALVTGILFERFVVAPIWNFTFRFASTPALTLESAVTDEATAVTPFDANGQGLIALELDGQRVQLLGTLQPSDRAMRVKVAAGARLRVEEVDAARNRCTVSLV